MKKYIPFHKIKDQEVIVVDGLHPRNLVLSHWKGANTLSKIAADTSGEIVLNAIEQNYLGVDCPKISATHFDIDGFVGVFTLFYPELAKEHNDALREMAIIGDFRHYNPKRKGAELALKLCCWMNKVEKEKFYEPFGDQDEIRLCVTKFDYFLKIFPEVIFNPESFRADWETEYNQVIDGLSQKINSQAYPSIGLIHQEVKKPIHYYALFSGTDNYDVVLSTYPINKYELEMKYTTWVDIVSRPVLPRVSLKNLAAELNKIEQNEFIWEVDGITDTGPILRLEKQGISKAERYANPYERKIYSSSIPEEKFVEIVINYLNSKYQNIKPKNFWTWEEMKKI